MELTTMGYVDRCEVCKTPTRLRYEGTPVCSKEHALRSKEEYTSTEVIRGEYKGYYVYANPSSVGERLR